MLPDSLRSIGLCVMLIPAVAMARTPSPKLVCIDPPNGLEADTAVTEVTLEFTGKTVLTQVTLERPDGTMQPIYERARKPFKGKVFNLALRDPADAPGTYAVHYIAWSTNMKSSTSGVWQFSRKAPEPAPNP